MNSRNPLEEHLKQLADSQQQPPPEMVWDEIEKTLDQKRKKRGFFFFWIIGVGMIAAISWGGYSYFSETGPGLTSLTSNSSSKSKSNSNTISIVGAEVNSSSNAKTASGAESATAADAILFSKNGKGEKSKTAANAGTGFDKNDFQSGISKKREKKSIDNSLKIKSLQDVGLIASNNSNSTVIDNENNTVVENAQPTVIIENTSIQSPPNDIDFSKVRTNSALPGLFIPLSLIDVKFPDRELPLEMNLLDLLQKKTKHHSSNYFLELEGGSGLSMNRILSLQQSTDMLVLRKATETPWYMWNAGLKAGIFFHDDWHIAAGVNYEQLKEKFDFIRTSVTRLMTSYDPDGNPIDSSLVTGTYINSTENVYTMIKIPVQVGYEVKRNDWIYGFEAGASVNYTTRATGRIFAESGEIEPLENLMQVHQLGFGLQGNIVLGRQLSEKMAVFIKPGYSFNSNVWDNGARKADSNIPSGYHLVRVNVGVRYGF